MQQFLDKIEVSCCTAPLRRVSLVMKLNKMVFKIFGDRGNERGNYALK